MAMSPTVDPTDRSMPPAIRIGVSATASRPSSTLNRKSSKKFVHVKKAGAETAKRTISARNARSSIRWVPEIENRWLRLVRKEVCIFSAIKVEFVDCDSNQDDAALN